MIVNFKYFYEKSDANYEEYNKQWSENVDKMIFLHTNLSLSQQITSITAELSCNKNILAIRFPSTCFLKKNKIINNIIAGKGFIYNNNQVLYPKEVWIYN